MTLHHTKAQMSSAVKGINRAPLWVWPRPALDQKHKVLKHQKKKKKNRSPPLFPFLPFLYSCLYTPSSPLWMSNQWMDTGNASHGWPYKALRKLLISGFRAQIACLFTSIASAPPLPPSHLYYHQHPVFISSYFTQGKGPRYSLHKGLRAAWILKITHWIFACWHTESVYKL